MSDILKKNWWAILIFGMAFTIRLVYLIQIRSNPFFESPMVDELWNLLWANDILEKSFWGSDVYFRGPLYPYFLALLVKITGSSFFWIRFIQIIIASSSVMLTYLIGRELFSERVAKTGSILHAIYGTLIFYETMLLIPVIFVFLNLMALLILIRNRDNPCKKPFFWAGLIFGLSAIARPNVLLIIPMLAIWLYYLFKKKIDTRSILVIILVFLVGVGSAVLPVTIRNYFVADDMVLISSQGGVNLYLGNNRNADGLTMNMPDIRLDSRISWNKFVPTITEFAEEEIGYTLKPSEVSSFWANKGKQFIFENPGEFLGLTYKKLVYFFSGFENSDQHDIYDFRQFSPLLSILIFDKWLKFPYGFFVPLALIGIGLCYRKRKELAPILIFMFGYIPTVILFLVTARHRLTIIPILLLFSAFALIYFWDNRANIKKLIIPISILLLFGLTLNANFFDLGFRNSAQSHYNLAISYSRQGLDDHAIVEYKLAIAETPGVPTLYFGLGTAYYGLKRFEESVLQLKQAISMDPEYTDAMLNLGNAYIALDENERAVQSFSRITVLEPERAVAYAGLGDALAAMKENSRAAQAYLTAINLRPDDYITHTKLGVLFGQAGDTAKANGFFRNFVGIDSTYAAGYLNWGNICLINGDTTAAIDRYNQAMRFDSSAIQPYYNLALLYTRLGDRTKALECLNILLRINPGFQPAMALKNQLGG